MSDLKLLRIAEIQAILPISRRHLYRLVERGEFPAPIKLSPAEAKNAMSAWLESEVIAYIRDRIAQSRPSTSSESIATPAEV